MHIIEHRYITGTEKQDKLIAIPELDREKLAVTQFINLSELNIELTRPTKFIYIGGVTFSQSEAGLGSGNGKYSPAIRSTSAYNAHLWCSQFKNRELLTDLTIVEGACAASINALKHASDAIYSEEDPAEEVIIIGHERITSDTLRLFQELSIPITCGDGFVYMRLGKGFDIADIKWKWAYHPNPFVFNQEDLDTLIPKYRIGYVKLHGTGTLSNNEAEANLEALATPIKYKDDIGHTQGISALLETCLVLNDPTIRGRILVTANGLGGYYGAFTLTKPNARNS